MFGVNPKQMAGMMKKMGISQTELDARRVIIELGEKNIVIDDPSVVRIVMKGQESFQISGETREEDKEGFSEEDVVMVMEKTGAGEEKVRDFLKGNGGDIALAIMELKEN